MILDGDKPSRIGAEGPTSPPGLGNPPDWFGELEREAWDRMASALEPMGIATRADSLAVELYCSSYALWRRALAIIERDGLMIVETIEKASRSLQGGPRTTTRTIRKVNPMIRVAAGEAAFMLSLLGKFGCTPASRTVLGISGEPHGSDDLLDFLRNRPGAN